MDGAKVEGKTEELLKQEFGVELKAPDGTMREFAVKEGVLVVDVKFVVKYAKSKCSSCGGAGYNKVNGKLGACNCAKKRFDESMPAGVKVVTRKVVVAGSLPWPEDDNERAGTVRHT